VNNDIYIIGGGPSLKDFDFEQLNDLDTIAVNVAALDVPNPTFSITADSGQFRKLQEGYFDSVNTTWVLVTNPDHCTMKWKGGIFKHVRSGYVYNLLAPTMVIKNAGVEGLGFSFNDFRTGYNSGFCALQLAVLLRYHRIHLLGIDLTDGHHYHDRYARVISKGDLRNYYLNFIRALKILKEKTDIQVISHSSISKLNKFIPYELFKKPEAATGRFRYPVTVKPPKKTTRPIPPPRSLTGKAGKTGIQLSILICSLENRTKSLRKLLSILKPQRTEEIEILVHTDRGQLTTGEKRNQLLENAVGEYIAFVDDDDEVSSNYIIKILKAIKSKPDCCGIQGIMSNANGRFPFVHSLKYKTWFKKGTKYYRNPNHLSPVKRTLALQVGFADVTVGEDKDYSKRLLPLLKTEEFISETLYFYLTG